MVDAVKRDADTYRAREDPLFAFIESELRVAPGKTVAQQDVLNRYNTWRFEVRDDYDAPGYSARDFGRALEVHRIPRRKVNGRRELVDWRLASAEERSDALVAQVAQNDHFAETPIGMNSIGITAKTPFCATNATDSAVHRVTMALNPPGEVIDEQPAPVAFAAARNKRAPTRQRQPRMVPVLTPRKQTANDAFMLPPDKCGHFVHDPAKDGRYRCDGCGSTWRLADLPVGMLRFVPDGFDRWDGTRWRHEEPQQFMKSAA